jgi:hypothetical protein
MFPISRCTDNFKGLTLQTKILSVFKSNWIAAADESTYATMDIDLLKARVQALAHLSTGERARLCNMAEADLRNVLREKMLLSDLPMFLSVDGAPARRRMVVPFYTVWSAFEGMFLWGDECMVEDGTRGVVGFVFALGRSGCDNNERCHRAIPLGGHTLRASVAVPCSRERVF